MGPLGRSNLNLGQPVSGKMLLALASTVVLASESRGARKHILLSYESRSGAIPPENLCRSVGRSGKLLLTHANAVIIGSEARRTHYQILLYHNSGSCRRNHVRRSVFSIAAGSHRQSFLASRLLEVHYKDFCSLLGMYLFRNGAYSSTRVGVKLLM
jgi:hypothetical protein